MSLSSSFSLPAATILAIKLVAELEGFSTYPYQDHLGIWKIGYGFTGYIQYDTPPIIMTSKNYLQAASRISCNAQTSPMSEDIAEEILFRNIQNIILELIIKWDNLQYYEYAALASLIYNINENNFYKNSIFPQLLTQLNPMTTKIPKLRAFYIAKIYDTFLKWCHIFGVENTLLKERRKKEANIFRYGNFFPSSTKDPIEKRNTALSIYLKKYRNKNTVHFL